MSGLDEARVFDNVARELRESLATPEDTLHLHFEVALLAHRRIKAERNVSGMRDVEIK